MRRLLPLMVLVILIAGCIPLKGDRPEPAVSEDISWWNEAVIYEIFVRSFNDSDGDGIGDFNGLTQKLDYLNDGNPDTRSDLGITAIWLMPIHPSPSYHGYDVINYYGINHDYGTMEDFKNFLSEAHKRGIRVIIDLVLNHTSAQHPFFIDSLRSSDSDFHNWYIWSPTSLGAGWHSAQVGTETMFYYGYFCGCMPDLDYSNPDVTTQMEKVAEFWLENVGVDGFRVDAVKHLIEENEITLNSPATHAWFKDFNDYYKSLNPEAYTVGEVANSDARIIGTYTGDQFDQIFNFEMASAVINSVYGEATSSIKSAVTFTQYDMPDWNFATFLTNHDQDRVMSVLGGNVEKAKVAAFILLTSPGTPYIYYGEEIGMQGRKPDEYIRRPMQWSTEPYAGFSTAIPWEELDPGYREVNVEIQLNNSDSLLAAYQKLIAIRSANPALSTGEYIPVASTNAGVYAFLRKKESTTLLIVVNLTKKPVSDFAISAQNTNIADGVYVLSDLYSESTAFSLTIREGGFKEFKPMKQLDPYTGYIYEFVK